MSPYFVEGAIFSDKRGTVRYANDFDFFDVKRFYVIEGESGAVRAWQGHKVERKYFYAAKGAFRICAVQVDNWEKPSTYLAAQEYLLDDAHSKVLCLPPGYANGFQPITENSVLLVFSSLQLSDSEKDTYRFDLRLWFDWDKPVRLA